MAKSEENRDEFWEAMKGCIKVCEGRGKIVVIVYKCFNVNILRDAEEGFRTIT